MNFTRLNKATYSLFLFLTFLTALSLSEVRAASLQGAWLLQEYRMEGKVVPASGVILFSETHFAMVYQMGDEADSSARAHAGRYQADGHRIDFEIPWWVQVVSGQGEVVTPTEAGGRLQWDGDSLLIEFDSGSVQKLKKVEEVATDFALSGGWKMVDYQSQAKVGATSGLLLMSPGYFAMVYTMTPDEGPKSGRGHGGSFEKSGDELVLSVEWSLHYVDGDGFVEEESSRRPIRISLQENQLTFNFESGARQVFERIGHESE